jgi:hypothetical protein
VSMAVMLSGDIFTNVTKAENDSFEMGPRDCFRFVGYASEDLPRLVMISRLWFSQSPVLPVNLPRA